MKRTNVVKFVLWWYAIMALVGFMVSGIVLTWQDVEKVFQNADHQRILVCNQFWGVLDESATLDKSQWTSDMRMANEFYTDVIVGLVADDPDQTIGETKSALDSLAGKASREYTAEFVRSMGFGGGRVSQGQDVIVVHSEGIDKFRQYRAQGSDGLIREVPSLRPEPVFLPVTVWRGLFAGSRIQDACVVFGLWFLGSMLTMVAFAHHSSEEETFDIFEQLDRPGERLARCIMALMLLPVLLGLGAGRLLLGALGIIRGLVGGLIQTVLNSYRLARHPNREEIHRARRAIRMLKSNGAEQSEITAAEELLRGLLIFNLTDIRPPRPSRAQRLRTKQLATAREDLERLRIEQELERSDAQASDHDVSEAPGDQDMRRKAVRSCTSEGT